MTLTLHTDVKYIRRLSYFTLSKHRLTQEENAGMNIDVKGVHLDISQNVRDYLNKKLKRLGYAEDLIVDLLFTLSQDSKAYKVEANINFRWGTSAHIGVDAFNLIKGIDQLLDKMDVKIKREKDKIQEHG